MYQSDQIVGETFWAFAVENGGISTFIRVFRDDEVR